MVKTLHRGGRLGTIRAGIAAVLLSALVFSPAGAEGATEPWPHLPVKTLSGKSLSLPSDLPPRPCILVVGFTRGSRAPVSAWVRRLKPLANRPGGVGLYQVAVLEAVPWLLRGLVVSRLRSDIPKRRRDQFVIVSQQARLWKRLVAFRAADAAYLVLTDAHHRVLWAEGQAPTDLNYQRLVKRLGALGVSADGRLRAPVAGDDESAP